MKKVLVVAAFVLGATQVMAGKDEEQQSKKWWITQKAGNLVCGTYNIVGGQKVKTWRSCQEVQEQMNQAVERATQKANEQVANEQVEKQAK